MSHRDEELIELLYLHIHELEEHIWQLESDARCFRSNLWNELSKNYETLNPRGGK